MAKTWTKIKQNIGRTLTMILDELSLNNQSFQVVISLTCKSVLPDATAVQEELSTDFQIDH